MTTEFNGLGMHLGNLSRLSAAKTRSISAENFKGEKNGGGKATEGTGENAARDLGKTWKVSPSVHIEAGETFTMAEIKGTGAIQQMWMTTHPERWRTLIVRIYWDDEKTPSVETPMGDFFCNGWGQRCNITSLPVAVNPAGGFNCYWEMPFRKHARITVENIAPDTATVYYQVNYTLTERARRCGLLSRAVSAQQPAALHDRSHPARWRARPRPLRRHVYCLGRQQQRLVGRRRDQVFYGWRCSGRRFAAPAPKTTLAAPGTLSIRRANTACSRRHLAGCRR